MESVNRTTGSGERTGARGRRPRRAWGERREDLRIFWRGTPKIGKYTGRRGRLRTRNGGRLNKKKKGSDSFRQKRKGIERLGNSVRR